MIPPSQIILALDAAMTGGSVTLYREQESSDKDGAVLASRVFENARGQAEILIPTIQSVLTEAEIEFAALTLIACTKGPGSFTGLRVAMTTAQTLAQVLGIPALGIETPTAVAASVPHEALPLVTLIETKRQEYYYQTFDAQNNPERPVQSLPFKNAYDAMIQRNAPFLLAGDCVERFEQDSKENALPLPPYKKETITVQRTSGEAIARLAAAESTSMAEKSHLKPSESAYNLTPFYVREADTSKPKTA